MLVATRRGCRVRDDCTGPPRLGASPIGRGVGSGVRFGGGGGFGGHVGLGGRVGFGDRDRVEFGTVTPNVAASVAVSVPVTAAVAAACSALRYRCRHRLDLGPRGPGHVASEPLAGIPPTVWIVAGAGGDRRAPPIRSTAAARVGRTRGLAATRDGQRAAAAAVNKDALPTRLSALTPARMLRGLNSFLFLEKENPFPKEPARERQAGGPWRKAGELPRRVGCDRRRAQVTGRATVHRPPCGLPASRSGSGRPPRRGRPRWAALMFLAWAYPVPTGTPAGSSDQLHQNGSWMLGIYRIHKYRRNLLTESSSVAIQVA